MGGWKFIEMGEGWRERLAGGLLLYCVSRSENDAVFV